MHSLYHLHVSLVRSCCLIFSILCTSWTRAALYNLIMLIMFDLYTHHWINSGTLSLNCPVSCSENLLLSSNYPLQPNISMHIIHTVLYTFPEVLSERICYKVKSFIKLVISLILATLMFDSGVIFLGEIKRWLPLGL